MAFFRKNLGFEDRVIRVLLAILFTLLGIKYTKWFFVLALLTLLEAVFSRCVFYALFKINTDKTVKVGQKPKKKLRRR